jgi:arylsulfatase A-like enzyme
VNVILIILDTVRADYLGCYGNPWIRTPNMDRLAADSFVFDEAYAEGCPTLQARRALWTGRRTFPYADHKVVPGDGLNLQPGWMPLHDEDYCLSEMLQDAGYVTTYITDVPQVFKPSMNFHRGFHAFEFIRGQAGGDRSNTGYRLPGERSACSTFKERQRQIRGRGGRTSTLSRDWEIDCMGPQVFTRGMRWLEHNDELEGFFLVVDSFDPHEPWDPPDYYKRLYTREQLLERPYELVSPRGKEITEDEIVKNRAGHAGEITMVDRWLGYFLQSAEMMGLMDNTLICLLSDHGTNVGDHGMIHKSPDDYFRGVARVPMMLRYPDGLGAGKRTDAMVYNMDLVPTILKYTGATPHERVEARDLTPLVRGETDTFRDCVTSGYNPFVYYHDTQWDYSEDRSRGPLRLYDWKADPEERVNLLAERPEVVEAIKKNILEEAGPTPPFEFGDWPPPPEYVKQFHAVRKG